MGVSVLSSSVGVDAVGYMTLGIGSVVLVCGSAAASAGVVVPGAKVSASGTVGAVGTVSTVVGVSVIGFSVVVEIGSPWQPPFLWEVPSQVRFY